MGKRTTIAAAVGVLGSSAVCAWILFRVTTPIATVKTEVDLGMISVGETLTYDIPIRNDGVRPLTITRVTTSCSCIKTQLSSAVVERDKAATLSVTLRGQNVEEGAARVVIETNDITNPTTALMLRYTQRRTVDIRPKSVDFGRIERNELPAEREIDICVRDPNLEDASLQIVVEPRQECLEFHLVRNVPRGCWKLCAIIHPNTPNGVTEGRVLVRNNVGTISEVVPFYVETVPDK